MTRGNQRERDRVRAQNRNDKAVAHSQLDANQKALSVICTVCRQAFMCTTNKSQLIQHVDSKHSKSTFDVCFPNYSDAK